MRENWNRELLEIVRQAIVTASEERAGLRAALQHESSTRTYSQCKLFRLACSINNLERVVVQARIYLDVVDGFLHGQHFAQLRNGLQRLKRILPNALAQDLPFGFMR